jgi:aminomethyltransferase
MQIKRTELYQKHVDLGAKMLPFAGYDMPVSYSTITEEHLNVRNNVGVFDVSHMGEFIVEGKGAMHFIQSISSNNAARLNVGDAQYSCLPNDKGGIVDDFILYRLDDADLPEGTTRFMMVVNAANIQKDWEWIHKFKTNDVQIRDESDKWGILAVQGPKAANLLSQITDEEVAEIPFYNFITGTVAGVDNVIISATGYTGSGGFELYVKSESMGLIWDAIFSTKENTGVMPAGLGARDTLRLEMGYCLYGNDLNDATSPLEAGLGWITKLKKEEEFPSKEQFIAQKEQGIEKKLIGFEMDDKRIPRKDYTVFDTEGREIGIVTSGTQSPSLDIPIGMAYVRKSYAIPGTPLLIDFGKKKRSATVVKMPFYKDQNEE